MKEKDGKRHFEVMDDECVACNLCVERLPGGQLHHHGASRPKGVDPRTGRKVDPDYANWTTHPNNPMALKAAE